MKIIKQGNVLISRIECHRQSCQNELTVVTIHHLNLNVKTWLFGDKKIQIKLSDDNLLANPTILSTDDDWESFDQDDAIEIIIKERMFQTILVYYNKKYLVEKYTKC